MWSCSIKGNIRLDKRLELDFPFDLSVTYLMFNMWEHVCIDYDLISILDPFLNEKNDWFSIKSLNYTYTKILILM